MRLLMAGVLVLGLTAVAVRADDPPATKASGSSRAFETLKEEYENAQKKYVEERQAAQKEAMKALREAKTDADKQAAQKKLRETLTAGPAQQFSARFLDFAEKNPQAPEAFEALFMALRTSGGPTAKGGTWATILQHLQAHYTTRPEIGRMVRVLGNMNDEAATKLVREIIAKNPDHKIQGRACKALAEGRTKVAKLADQLKANPRSRQLIEEQAGKDYVAKLLADAEKAQQELQELTRLVREKYADVFPDLTVGKPAPEVVSQDLDGKEVKLSALKGNVVVLDLWVTASNRCKAMIPQQRELVSRLKDKPFVLVSMSADEKKTTLTDFLAKEKMPWTHWWNGDEGGIIDDWEVRTFPTIYILDAQGVIRFKDVKGDQLEEAVYELLKELEKKPK
jgi:peroxiredoxin